MVLFSSTTPPSLLTPFSQWDYTNPPSTPHLSVGPCSGHTPMSLLGLNVSQDGEEDIAKMLIRKCAPQTSHHLKLAVSLHSSPLPLPVFIYPLFVHTLCKIVDWRLSFHLTSITTESGFYRYSSDLFGECLTRKEKNAGRRGT